MSGALYPPPSAILPCGWMAVDGTMLPPKNVVVPATSWTEGGDGVTVEETVDRVGRSRFTGSSSSSFRVRWWLTRRRTILSGKLVAVRVQHADLDDLIYGQMIEARGTADC